MITQSIVFPVLIPLFTGIIILLLRRRLRVIRVVSLTGSFLALLTAVALLLRVAEGDILVAQMGGWLAPYGITFVVDLFSAIMLTLGILMGMAEIDTMVKGVGVGVGVKVGVGVTVKVIVAVGVTVGVAVGQTIVNTGVRLMEIKFVGVI